MSLSNRAYGWLCATLIGSIVALSLVIAHMQDIIAAWLWIRWILLLIGLIFALYALYLLWHQVSIRYQARHHQAQETKLLIAGYEDEKWRADQTLLHAHQMEQARIEVEREKIRLDQMKMQLEHERLLTVASWQAQHVTVPAGHGLYIREESGYNMVQAPQVTGHLVDTTQPQLKPGKPVMIPVPQELPGAFDLLNVFRHGCIAPDHLFMGKLDGNDPLYIDAVKKLCHGAINAITGRGKTIIKRGLEAQFLSFGFDVLDLDLKFTLIDEEGLDYRPFAKHLLSQPPIEVQPGVLVPRLEVNAQRIALVLQWLAEVEVPRRLDLYHRGIHNYKTLYVFIEEMLYLVAKCPEITEYLKEVLPVARSLGIKVFVSAQNFQVQSIQLPGGMRENFETAYYNGGDDLSGAKLLDISQAELLRWLTQYNITLGKGVSLIRNNFLVEKPRLLRVGMASNEAIYYLLGRADDFVLPTPGTGQKSHGTLYLGQTRPVTSNVSTAPAIVATTPNSAPVERTTGPLAEETETPLNADGKRGPVVSTKSPNGQFMPGPDDRVFTPDQEQEFITRYRKQQLPVKGILRQMNNGQGLTNRYSKHASWIIEHYGLRKEA
jgi:hypothetical protein